MSSKDDDEVQNITRNKNDENRSANSQTLCSTTALLRSTTSPFSRPDSESDYAPGSENSNDSVRCRVCLLSVVETEKPLVRLGCLCRGTLEYAHAHCIQQWVHVQDSRTCELCKTAFGPNVLPQFTPANPRRAERPNLTEDAAGDLWQRIELSRQERNQRIWARTNRIWFGVLSILLVFATASSGSLTAHAHHDLIEYRGSIVNGTANVSESPELTRRFYVSLFFLFFSLAATCFIFLLWTFFEVYLWPRETQLMARFRLGRTAVQINNAPLVAAPHHPRQRQQLNTAQLFQQAINFPV